MEKSIKINLGCGYDFSADLIGFDKHDYGQQHVLDIEIQDLPFPNGTVEYIKMHHSLEHIADVQHILNECWRVLAHDGFIEIWVPNGFWKGAYNPTHKQIMTPSWFDFLTRSKTKYYGYKRWEIIKLDETEAEIYCKMKPYAK